MDRVVVSGGVVMFPKGITTAMTIYNLQGGRNAQKWIPTQLQGVFWDNAKARNVMTSGILSADELNLYIPMDVVVLGEEKEYREPKAFQENPQGAWTLQMKDIVVKGLVEDEILGQTDLENKYDEVYIISTVDPKLFGSRKLWHWEVGAT